MDQSIWFQDHQTTKVRRINTFRTWGSEEWSDPQYVLAIAPDGRILSSTTNPDRARTFTPDEHLLVEEYYREHNERVLQEQDTAVPAQG